MRSFSCPSGTINGQKTILFAKKARKTPAAAAVAPYFEGHGPAGFAKHGYSRDGQPRNVQVVVGMVMVAGWPIAHHVWAGNTRDSKTVAAVVQDLTQRFQFRRAVFVGDR